jgi:hypothetical protein
LANDGTIKLKDSYGVTKVSLNYDTTNTTDPLNSSGGSINITGISAGTAHFETGSLSGQGGLGYLQTPGGGRWPYAPTWNTDTNFTVPLTAAYEFTLSIPTTTALKVTALTDTAPEYNPGPYVALRLYIYEGGTNIYPGEYVSGLVESATGQPYGKEYYTTNPANVFYMNGLNLVAGVTYRFTLQYIVFNVDYNNVLDINYYLPNTTVSYNAAVASSNMNQTGINLGQDTDRYIFTKPGILDFYDNSAGQNTGESAEDRRTIGEMAGSMLLLNSDARAMSSNQRLYISQASYPRINRSSGGNFITSHFFGGYNRAFLPIRAYAMFEPDASTNHTLYNTSWWPYSHNVETITYVTTNTFAVTFVEPIFSTESFTSNGNKGFYTVGIISHNTGGITLVTVTNQTYTGFTIELSGEESSGSLIGIIVYK